MDNTCNKKHRYNPKFNDLPLDQGNEGRHKYAGCAYELGKNHGLEKRSELNINIDLDNLPFSQAGTVRHRSPHVAYARGYYDGIRESYNLDLI
ncbi:MAG: hypothetical protein HZA78_04255 [Candidatus Schekmanbacteria bacterium]|nr:hypothetical protein [Candidatus Schekmanbacteria bacterium]